MSFGRIRKDRYAIRALKYFILLLVLLALVGLLNFSHMALKESVGIRDYIALLMNGSTRSKFLLPTLALLALSYPWFGFMERGIRGSLATDLDGVRRAFAASGFEQVGERDGKLLFRASTGMGRARLLWEDEIEVWQRGDQVVLSGIRSAVARVIYRMEVYLRNSDE